jgi:glycosyltransferase involved in cell wall biosynthesis
MTSRPNVLLVSARTPWPTASGGQQRTFLLCKAIQRIADLHLLLVDPKPKPSEPDIEMMKEEFGLGNDAIVTTTRSSRWRRLGNPGRHEFAHSDEVTRAVTEAATRLQCTTVVFRYLPLASRSAGSHRSEIRRLVDIDDVPSLRSATEAAQEHGLRAVARRWIAAGIERWQKWAIAQTDGGWVACEEDLGIIDDERFSVLPNIPLQAWEETADSARCLQNPDSRTVLFVGAMGYEINCQAMDWFLSEVWPIVVRERPGARLDIAGGGLDDERRSSYAGIQGVRLLGYVDDLAAAYAASALSVVPISAGAGTKIKVLESYRYGRPVVVTRHSLRGYGHVLQDGRDLLVADEPAHMASAIVSLLDSPDNRESMARSGQALVDRHFGFDRFSAIVADTLGKHLIGGGD